MSCTVFALPYAIAWVVGAVFANVPYSEIALDNEGMNNIDFSGDIDLPTVCDDVRVISDKHFLEKSFETAFVDKELLIKTLEEAGVDIEDIENPNKDFYVKLNVKDDIIELYDSATNRLIETISGNELGELVQKLNMASGIFVNKKV